MHATVIGGGIGGLATAIGLGRAGWRVTLVDAVADETPAAAFELSGRAVELGHDLRSVLRELSRVVRDLLVLSVDPSRIDDPEIASESERDRLKALAGRFSREDLLRAFDVLSKADFDIRSASQPRYHLEMALLRWIHLRKLVPLTELLGGLPSAPSSGTRPAAAAPKPAETFARKAAPLVPPVERRAPAPVSKPVSLQPGEGGPVAPKPVGLQPGEGGPKPASGPAEGGRDAFLMEIRKSKAAFYNTVVAQAQKIEFGPERVTFSFLPTHRMLREQFEQNRSWLEQTAAAIAGKKIPVVAAQAEGVAEPVAAAAVGGAASPPTRADLKTTAMGDSAVQAMLDVFPVEIENVEEIE